MLSEKLLGNLKKNRLFDGIPGEELEKLDDSLFEIKDYYKDDLIIEQNADPDGIYLILKGSVIIKKFTMKETSSELQKQEIILNYCNKHEFVGELALVSNKKRAANVYCFSKVCRIIFVNTDDFYKIFDIIPGIQKNLGKTIAERLGETSIRAANESNKYKKLYELQIESSKRTTELLRSQKDFEKQNKKLLDAQKSIRRTAIVDTILMMINTVKYDFCNSIDSVLEKSAKLKETIDRTDDKLLKDISGSVLDELNDIKHKIEFYSESSMIEFGRDEDGRKIILFRKKQ